MDRKRKIDVELPLFPLEIAAIGKLLLAICIFSSRRKSQRFTNYISRKRIFETNPQLFILLLPISRNCGQVQVSKFVFI